MTTTTTPASATSPSARRPLLRASTTAAAAALASNLVLFVIGRGTGIDFMLTPARGPAVTVTAVSVVVVTLLAVAAGAVLTLVLLRLPRPRLSIVLVGAAVTTVSLGGPLPAEAATGAKVLLAMMHIATGAAYVGFISRTVARSPVTHFEP